VLLSDRKCSMGNEIMSSLFSVPEPALSAAEGCLRGEVLPSRVRISCIGLGDVHLLPSSSESEG